MTFHGFRTCPKHFLHDEIMFAKFHVNNLCGLGRNCLKYAPPPSMANFYVKHDSITLEIMKNGLG